MGKWRFLLYAGVLALPWMSQAFYPNESIWEPIFWTLGLAVAVFAIEKWGKP